MYQRKTVGFYILKNDHYLNILFRFRFRLGAGEVIRGWDQGVKGRIIQI